MTLRRLSSPALAASLLAAVAAFGAGAQSNGAGADANITGAWTFETKVFDVICRITGTLELAPSGAPGEYVGELYAHQRCGTPELGYEDWRAEQTVEAVREGDRLSITSTIVRVTPPTELYFPDDFELEIIDGSLMMGELHSINVTPAVFQRGDMPIA